MDNNRLNPICYTGEALVDLGYKITAYGKQFPTNRVAITSLFRHDGLLEFHNLGSPTDIISTLMLGATSFLKDNARDKHSEIYFLAVICNDLMRRIQEIAQTNNINITQEDIAKMLDKEPCSFIY